MRRPNPGGAMITTMQAVSRKVNLRVGGHRSDTRLDIRESTPDWSSFTGPTPKARVQPVHHTAQVTGGSLHCVVPNAATSRSLAWNATRPPGSPETKPEERAWPGWKPGLKNHTRERLRGQRDRDQRHREKVDS